MTRRKTMILTGLLSAVIALVSQLPLSWFVPKAMHAQGTVWKGQITPISGMGPGNIETSLKRLFSGKTLVELKYDSPGLTYQAGAGFSGLKQFDFKAELSSLPVRDARLNGLKGALHFNLSGILLKSQSCTAGKGEVWTDILMVNQGRLQWSGPEMAGPISCEDGNLVARLSGTENGDEILANFTVQPSGIYQSEIIAKIEDARAQSILGFMGFSTSEEGYRLSEQGKWR